MPVNCRLLPAVLIVATLLVSLFSNLFIDRPTADAQSDIPAAALEAIAQINAYRIQRAIMPLAINPVLTQMARDQAEYVASLGDIPGGSAIHTGRRGEQPRERAVQAPYNWQTYGTAAQVVLSENAGVGNIRFVMNFWSTSTLHRTTMENGNYREIGAWTVKKGTDTIYIIVFAARPSILPVLYDPNSRTLYISTENNTLGNLPIIRAARTIRLFDAAGNPLTETMNWASRMVLPENAGTKIEVLYSDGTHEVRQPVDLERDIVVLPETLSVVQALAPSAANNATPTGAVPTTAPALFPTNTPQGGVALPTNTPPAALPTNTPPAAIAQNPTAATTIVASTTADLRVIYDAKTLSITNISTQRLDITQLAVTGGGQRLNAARWAQFTPVRFNDFPPNGCVQVWNWNEPVDLPKPPICTGRVSFLTISPTNLFWAAGDFEVLWGEQVIARCAGGSGSCDVILP